MIVKALILKMFRFDELDPSILVKLQVEILHLRAPSVMLTGWRLCGIYFDGLSCNRMVFLYFSPWAARGLAWGEIAVIGRICWHFHLADGFTDWLEDIYWAECYFLSVQLNLGIYQLFC